MIKWFNKNIGEDFVSNEVGELLACSTDASNIQGQAELIVRPNDVKQLHQIILFLKREKKHTIIRGAATGLRGGAVPKDNAVVIDLIHLNKILETTNDYVRVEPGIILSNLNRELKKKGKILPITPLSYECCTIGGMIATNATTVGANLNGKIGNWLMDVDVIDGEGRYRKSELKEVVGKEGTTGVIIAARLKIIDLPKTEFEMYQFGYIDEMLQKVPELKEVNSILFINKKAAETAEMESENYLLVENSLENIGRHVKTEQILEEADLYDDLEPTKPEEKLEEKPKKYGKNRLMDINTEVYNALINEGYEIMEDVKIPLENMEKFLLFLEKNETPAFGPIGLGIIYPFFKDESTSKRFYELVKNFGGSVLGAYGAGLQKKEHISIETKQKIKQLRTQYDSEDIINRGLII